MVENRQVTGQAQGDLLAHLLNQKVEKCDRRAALLQRELERLFTGISTLLIKLAKTDPGAHLAADVKQLIDELNAFLKTCAEYPQVFPARPRRAPPFFVLEYVPTKSDPLRRDAVSSLCALVRYGLLDRVRQCQRTTDQQGGICGIWFFAKKSDSKYHSHNCQTKPTEEYKRRKREYAKRYYWEEKERERLAELKISRGDRK